MTHSQAELGWAAGCVDGEGCISIRREAVSRSGRPQYAHAARAIMKERIAVLKYEEVS